ncbi:MAG: rod shape-determining protein MreC [Lentisphaeria bacterium]|nr:rod shape-determining protein MreC [Lentisphaeria bacterium]
MAGHFRNDPGRNWTILAVVLFLLLLLLAGYHSLREAAGRFTGNFFYPYLSLARAAHDRLSDQTLLFYNRLELAARVRQLTETNRHLALQAAAAAALLDENAELRKLLDLTPAAGWKYVPAEIILRDPQHWEGVLVINRGLESGIRPGAAAVTVTPDGRPILAGVVRQVNRNSAEIITVRNPALQCSVRLMNSNATGILHSGGRRPGVNSVPIGFLPMTLHPVPREAVFTTGYENGIPAGIKIGEMLSIEENNGLFTNDLHLSGMMEPAAYLGSIRFLMISCRADGR